MPWHECKSINNHKRFISFPVAVMRLGKKKEKDKEAEIRSVDGIIRLICLSKGQAPLKGWLNIKLIIERISDGFAGCLSVWILEDPPWVNVKAEVFFVIFDDFSK